MEFHIGSHKIGPHQPTYFIADIAANHDGSLERAKQLIRLAAQGGANAAKFQNFRAPEIVSDYGFKALGGQQSHQSSWKKSVFEVYKDASIPFEWTPELKAACDEAGIDYFSAPYDFEAIDMLDEWVPAYKVGSGDITWPESLVRMARKGKPVLLATGASTIGDVQRAVHIILEHNRELVLMQCNTNYTASLENFDHIHLNVLKTYGLMFPDVVLGLSDHTPGHATVLGAVALGARVIEKHYTDDNNRVGPDHKFAMNPDSWAAMVENTRQLERALGSADKFVAGNEQQTVVVQRRCVRTARDLKAGETVTREMLSVLRPATPGAILPYEIEQAIGTRVLRDIPSGKELRWTDLGE
ncbi:MAG TPA: N-acetylneuraminate synthase family protein [Anaerolineaceae bacterium]